ncbi:OrP1 [Eciton burchellii]|nr:OrP1 [Eciton burchellii]
MANRRRKDDIAYVMNLFKFVLWPIGIWPLQTYDIYLLMRCILGICCASIVAILPANEIFLGCTDTELSMDCLLLINCALMAILKNILFRVYGNDLADNYGSAMDDYLTIEDEKQRAIMRRHAFMGRILFYSMMGINYCGCITIGLVPVLVDDNKHINVTNKDIRKYAIPSRCFLDYFNFSYNVYRIVCIFEAFLILITSYSYVGIDVIFLNITLHMCGQLEILKHNFMNLDVTIIKIHDCFSVLIQRHIYLIQKIKKLIRAVSFILLMQLLTSSILICIAGFQLIVSLKMKDIVMSLKSFMILNTFLLQLALYSLVGDYLKSQVNGVGYFVYQSAWYNLPVGLMKSVIFILMRTRCSVALRAGRLIEVNLSTYMSILKTSVSYLSVLHAMME